MSALSLRLMTWARTMADVAGELEALILIGVPGEASQLLAALPIADLAIEDARLIPISDAVRACCHRAVQDDEKGAGFRELTRGVVELATAVAPGGRVCALRVLGRRGHMPPSHGIADQ